jgi:hypothetical protein
VSGSQDHTLQTPITPATPATTEALMSLHDLINRELDAPSKCQLQRHVQKLASAAKISSAKRALLQDQNQFLSKINNEVKIRQSTRSVVLGKAKAMSYEDPEEAPAKRAARHKATADRGKGKRGRPRKFPAVGTEGEVETSVDVEAEGDSSAPQNEGARPKSERPLFPWRALVARMY